MPPPVKPWPFVTYTVAQAGKSIIVAYGPIASGVIVNPLVAEDQGVPVSEALFVDLTGPAALQETRTTFLLGPGQSAFIPAGFQGQVWVNAVTSGHRFSGVVWQPAPSYQSQVDAAPGGIVPFPPLGPTTMLETIPSYLYQQYSDDDDLQAFVAAYNILAQQYVDWFVNANLPNYTVQQGPMLDWIAAGLYGYARPTIPKGTNKTIGPLNTWAMNTLPLNVERTIYPHTFYLTTDDIFKRILTWHFFKGDGKVFDVRWLKRRIMRFLVGTDGGPGPDGVLGPANTDSISISFGLEDQVNIGIGWRRRTIRSGAIFNRFMFNTKYLNELDMGSLITSPALPMAPVFKAAMDAGLLEIPFQYGFTVTLVES